MKDKIVMTSNLTIFASTVENLKNISHRMDCLGLIYGRWGLGKTTAMQWFFAHNQCFYCRAWEAWRRSTNMMIEDLLRCYRVEAKGRLKFDLRELVRTIKKHGFPLFIDEADRVVRQGNLIETIRDLHDLSQTPIILIGGENIIHSLQRRDLSPVFSRITSIGEFKELTSQDIQHISTELCDLQCNAKVASYIRTVTLGDFRLLNALLIKAEELCALNKTPEISLPIAKEASTVMPRPDDLRKNFESEKDFAADSSKRLRVGGMANG